MNIKLGDMPTCNLNCLWSLSFLFVPLPTCDKQPLSINNFPVITFLPSWSTSFHFDTNFLRLSTSAVGGGVSNMGTHPWSLGSLNTSDRSCKHLLWNRRRLEILVAQHKICLTKLSSGIRKWTAICYTKNSNYPLPRVCLDLWAFFTMTWAHLGHCQMIEIWLLSTSWLHTPSSCLKSPMLALSKFEQETAFYSISSLSMARVFPINNKKISKSFTSMVCNLRHLGHMVSDPILS